jgi:hypothetical protein
MADLGGLGAKEGTAVQYQWTPPSLLPVFLPWLAVLGFLALPSNRNTKAWFVLVPLLCVVMPLQFSQSLLGLLPSSGFQLVADAPIYLAFGLAAVWLLADHIVRNHRFVTFLCTMVIMGVVGILAYAARQDWSESQGGEALALLVMLAFASLVIPLAMLFTGLLCKRNYSFVKVLVCLGGFLCAIWFVMTAPFFVIACLSSGGRIPVMEFFLPIGGVSIASLGLMLPFLLLSAFNSLYADRLKALLHVLPPASPEVPPAMTPVAEAPVPTP